MNGFGHIDLTVTDLDRSVRWWEEVMGFRLIHTRERPDFKLCTVIHTSGFFVGLMQHTNGLPDRFDERAVGLDHFALRVPDRAALEGGRSVSTTSGLKTRVCRTNLRDPSSCFATRQHPARTLGVRSRPRRPGSPRVRARIMTSATPTQVG
jgi:catechol 2,3-dioxygenase-like lactoylglutathione lyase family enzyme